MLQTVIKKELREENFWSKNYFGWKRNLGKNLKDFKKIFGWKGLKGLEKKYQNFGSIKFNRSKNIVAGEIYETNVGLRNVGLKKRFL